MKYSTAGQNCSKGKELLSISSHKAKGPFHKTLYSNQRKQVYSKGFSEEVWHIKKPYSPATRYKICWSLYISWEEISLQNCSEDTVPHCAHISKSTHRDIEMLPASIMEQNIPFDWRPENKPNTFKIQKGYTGRKM